MIPQLKQEVKRRMMRSTLWLAGLAGLTFGVAIAVTALTIETASAQSTYMSQRAVQDRDYSRLHSATQRAYGGKTMKVTLGRKKTRHKHKKWHRKIEHHHG
jgi:hypothetical protein